MGELKIRRATEQDIPDVCRVVKAVYDEYGFEWDPEGYHWDLYNLKEAYDDHGDEFYVGEFDGKVVGTVAYERFETIPGEPGNITYYDGYVRVAGANCSLERLYIPSEFRGMKLGRKLTEFVLDRARSDGRSVLELWSDKRFEVAHKLYESIGANIIGERICDDPEQSEEWGLVLML